MERTAAFGITLVFATLMGATAQKEQLSAVDQATQIEVNLLLTYSLFLLAVVYPRIRKIIKITVNFGFDGFFTHYPPFHKV